MHGNTIIRYCVQNKHIIVLLMMGMNMVGAQLGFRSVKFRPIDQNAMDAEQAFSPSDAPIRKGKKHKLEESTSRKAKKQKIRGRASDNLGFISPTKFAREPWSEQLVAIYEKRAKDISDASPDRVSPENWATPMDKAHEAFEILLETLETRIPDDLKAREHEANAIAQELQEETIITTSDAFTKWLGVKSNSVISKYSSLPLLPVAAHSASKETMQQEEERKVSAAGVLNPTYVEISV